MSIQDGHRNRMKERFIQHGIENFNDVNVLEILLFYGIPRKDVNALAHVLMDRFGSLAAVFDAPPEELLKVEGMGKNVMVLLKLIPQVARRYQVSKSSFHNILDSTARAGEYLLPKFFAEKDEVVYIACLDAKGKVLYSGLLARGSVNSASVSVRKIVETALTYNSTSVILAHNHTSGIALPSHEDRATTRRIAAALGAVDIRLTDHIIVADNDYVSLADSGFFD